MTASYRSPAGPFPKRLGDREAKVIEAAAAEAATAAEALAASSTLRIMKATILFSDLVDGDAVEFGSELPSGAIIGKVYARMKSTFEADGDDSSTISLGLNTASDVLTATAISGAPFSTTGMKALKDGAAANMIVLTAARTLTATLTILTTDTELTDGEMDVYVEYAVEPA